MKLNDIDEKKIEHRQKNVYILQLQQFAGMLLFLVTNRIYKSDSSDKLLQVMFMTSYLVFLGTTVKTLNDYNRLYYDIKKKAEKKHAD
jgi:low temperature requirement protein LtrA